MIRIDSIKISAKSNVDIITFVCDKYKLKKDTIKDFKIIKKSLDARNKSDIQYLYSVSLNAPEKSEKYLINNNKNISEYIEVKYSLPKANISDKRTIVIGFGPAGLFASYLLALKGFKPIVIERGEDIEARKASVENFWNDNSNLNLQSNVQFGEGGAGTFSDGKLNTGVKDKEGRINYILETFVKYGAKENILFDSKPHVGTDILANVVKAMREEIISLGGDIRFNTKLNAINYDNNNLKSITCFDLVNSDSYELDCNKLILAIGHSSRDTFRYLSSHLTMEQKPFAMGFRVIHPQKLINTSQYGINYEDIYENLPECSYKLTYQTKKENRGVYSFCMCPGGYVVNASSEESKTCVNGMSYNDRASGYANSAIIVQISPEDLNSNNPLEGMYFQEKVENKAYNKGNGKIPVSRFSAFKKSDYIDATIELSDAIKGEFVEADLIDIFPAFINDSFIEGMTNFNGIIKDFAKSNPYIAGVEARTSSPIKIIRDENYESNIKGIYPCGEGAGYAGGIISAAIDGMKVAEQIIKE